MSGRRPLEAMAEKQNPVPRRDGNRADVEHTGQLLSTITADQFQHCSARAGRNWRPVGELVLPVMKRLAANLGAQT